MTLEAEMYDLGNGTWLCFNFGGRFHGWLFTKHADGYHVSLRKLEPGPVIYEPTIAALFVKAPALSSNEGDGNAGG